MSKPVSASGKIIDLKMILALSENGTLGKNNSLPWDIPEDLKRFHKIINNCDVVVGRKTFDSIIKNNLKTALHKWKNNNFLVLTKDNYLEYKKKYSEFERIKIYQNLDELNGFLIARSIANPIWIIGGKSVYQQLFKQVDSQISSIDLTRVPGEYDGDCSWDLDTNSDEFKLNFKLSWSEKRDLKEGPLVHERWLRL